MLLVMLDRSARRFTSSIVHGSLVHLFLLSPEILQLLLCRFFVPFRVEGVN